MQLLLYKLPRQGDTSKGNFGCEVGSIRWRHARQRLMNGAQRNNRQVQHFVS